MVKGGDEKEANLWYLLHKCPVIEIVAKLNHRLGIISHEIL